VAEDVEDDFIAVEPSRLYCVDEEVRGVEANLLVPLVCRGVAGGVRAMVRRWRWRSVVHREEEKEGGKEVAARGKGGVGGR
jgi:hypothetical protein